MKRIATAFIMLTCFPVLVSAACGSYTAMPPGVFSEGTISEIKLVPDLYKYAGVGELEMRVHYIYLDSFKMNSSATLSTCGYFTIITGTDTTYPDYYIYYYYYNDTVKMVRTAFALNYYLEGKVKEFSNVLIASPTVGVDGYLSVKKRN